MRSSILLRIPKEIQKPLNQQSRQPRSAHTHTHTLSLLLKHLTARIYAAWPPKSLGATLDLLKEKKHLWGYIGVIWGYNLNSLNPAPSSEPRQSEWYMGVSHDYTANDSEKIPNGSQKGEHKRAARSRILSTWGACFGIGIGI